MTPLLYKRFILWKALKKYGNPHNYSFSTVMLGTWPVLFKDGCMFFTFEEDGLAIVHSAVKRYSDTKARTTLDYLKSMGFRYVGVYRDENQLINRICERWGATLIEDKYILEI